MLPTYVSGVLGGRLHVNEHVTIVRDGGAVTVLDGNAGFGQVMGKEAMDLAIDRAASGGAAIVGLRNSYHIGRIGHWAEQCAVAGMASIHLVNVAGHAPFVAPHGGGDGRFATNPICIGLPGRDGVPAAMVDMATSQIALGKVRVAFNSGQEVPPGTLLDPSGEVTTDPSWMFQDGAMGALTTAGGHKGSGLAVMCELLGAALIGGETIQPSNDRDGSVINNMLSIVIDPRATHSQEAVLAEAEAYLAYVAASPPRAGVDSVLLPGQPEQISRVERAGGFDVDATTVAQLRQCAEAADVALPGIEAGLAPQPHPESE